MSDADQLPRVFVASSSSGAPIMSALIKLLNPSPARQRMMPWPKAFDKGTYPAQDLINEAHDCDFAILVLTPDDTRFKDHQLPVGEVVPRDNVLFELGLFMGVLGQARCFCLEPVKLVNGKEQSLITFPSDYHGIIHVRYFYDQLIKPIEEENFRITMAKPVLDIGAKLKKNGLRKTKGHERMQMFQRSQLAGLEIVGEWWESINGSKRAEISHVIIEQDPAGPFVKLTGTAFNKEGKAVSDWESTHSLVSSPDQRLPGGTVDVFYRWTGSYNFERKISASHATESHGSAAVGWGEINYTIRPGQTVDVLRGIFQESDTATTATPPDGDGGREDKTAQATSRMTKMVRCTKEESAIMGLPRESPEVTALIRSKLRGGSVAAGA